MALSQQQISIIVMSGIELLFGLWLFLVSFGYISDKYSKGIQYDPPPEIILITGAFSMIKGGSGLIFCFCAGKKLWAITFCVLCIVSGIISATYFFWGIQAGIFVYQCFVMSVCSIAGLFMCKGLYDTYKPKKIQVPQSRNLSNLQDNLSNRASQLHTQSSHGQQYQQSEEQYQQQDMQQSLLRNQESNSFRTVQQGRDRIFD